MVELNYYESDEDIQAIPIGEESFHEFGFECDCDPDIYTNGSKYICYHKSFSTEDILDMAEFMPYHTVRQKFDIWK